MAYEVISPYNMHWVIPKNAIKMWNKLYDIQTKVEDPNL